MKKIKKILVIIQRSNGDVFLSTSLIRKLYSFYESPAIDLLINDDTNSIASLIPHIRKIHTFSYMQKKNNRWKQEVNLLFKLFKKYDLSINLTSSDRSVFYSLMAGKKSISAVEIESRKSWWKKIFLTHYYYFDNSNHILTNNLKPLICLNVDFDNVHYSFNVSENAEKSIENKLKKLKVKRFIIFHPSAQYEYKIYPQHLRNKLLDGLNNLGISIIITGSNNSIDMEVKKNLPSLPNIIDFIGDTSIEEFFVLSKLSLCYIGMDTLNMHIAASQNKRIFAIFGPTNLKMWSPWSNSIESSASEDKPLQTYGNVTIFQSGLPCVACAKAGCDNQLGRSECLYVIDPEKIIYQVKEWYEKL